MILTLQGPTARFDFAIKGSVSTGYTVNLDSHLKKEASRTHPAVVTWEGSEISDMPLTLFLAVSALDDDPVTKIPTPGRLLEIVETLHDWALPPAMGDRYLESITVNIRGVKGGRGWFERSALIKGINVEWKEPWDIETGIPMIAEVKMDLKIFIGNATYPTGDAVGWSEKYRPHRPWKFSKMWP